MSMKLYRGMLRRSARATRASHGRLATIDNYRLLHILGGQCAVYGSNATLRVQIGAQSGDPAGDAGIEGGAGIDAAPEQHLPPPLRVRIERAGETGARMRWLPPGFSDLPVLTYELEWSDGTAWNFMAKTAATEWTELAGVSGDYAWRVRAVYADGESEWVEASVIDLYSDGGAALAPGDAVPFEVLTNNASAELKWFGGEIADVSNWWPFGDVAGHGACLQRDRLDLLRDPRGGPRREPPRVARR